jgi:hypothetical protein
MVLWIDEERLIPNMGNQQLIEQTAARVGDAGGAETQIIFAACLR